MKIYEKKIKKIRRGEIHTTSIGLCVFWARKWLVACFCSICLLFVLFYVCFLFEKQQHAFATMLFNMIDLTFGDLDRVMVVSIQLNRLYNTPTSLQSTWLNSIQWELKETFWLLWIFSFQLLMVNDGIDDSSANLFFYSIFRFMMEEIFELIGGNCGYFGCFRLKSAFRKCQIIFNFETIYN